MGYCQIVNEKLFYGIQAKNTLIGKKNNVYLD